MRQKFSLPLIIFSLFFLVSQIPFSSALFSSSKTTPPSTQNSYSSPITPPPAQNSSKTNLKSGPLQAGAMPAMVPDSLTVSDFSSTSCKTKKILKNSKTAIRFLKNISGEQFIASGGIADVTRGNLPIPPFATGTSWIGQFDIKKKSLWQYCFSKRSSSPMPDDAIQDMIVTPDDGYFGVGQSSFGRSGIVGNAWVFKLNANGKLQWQKIYGRSYDKLFGSASLSSAVSTPDGGYAIAGRLSQLNDLTSPRCKVAVCKASREYAILMKLNADGEIQWQKTYGMDYEVQNYPLKESDGIRKESTEGGLSFERMLPMADGGFVVTGTTVVFEEIDAWFGRFDADGNVLWQKVFGKAKANEIKTIRKDHDGNLVIAGMLRIGFAKPWALKLDPNGKVLWQKAFGQPSTLEMFDMEESIDQKGYVFVERTIPTRADLEKKFAVPQTLWIFQLDSNGNFVWQKAYRTVMDTFSIRLRRFAGRYLLNSGLDLIPVDAMGNIKKLPPKILDPVKVNFPSQPITQDEVETDIQDYDIPISEEE